MKMKRRIKILEHREKPFPDDLEGRLNAVLNIVNSELKTLTLLHLDNIPADGSTIKWRLRQTVGRGVYLPRQNCFGDYCCRTLLPIGAVAEEIVLYEDTNTIITGYNLTEAGRKYGRPIAAFTLDYAIRNNMSMFEILGSTVSPGKSRSPLNRVKILEELKGRTLRTIDLARKVGVNGCAISDHLKALKKISFVSYESCGEISGHGEFLYIWFADRDFSQLAPVRRYSNLTYVVAEKLKELGKANSYLISRGLNYKYPNIISIILSGLEKQGFAKRVKKWKPRENLSEASLTMEGKSFLEGYVNKVREALEDGKKLSTMTKFLGRLIEDESTLREYTKKGIALYKGVSKHINFTPFSKASKKIMSYLKQNPGERPNRILTALSISGIWCLSTLVKAGRLRRVKQGKIMRYYVNE